ncbi:MAG TPA: XdhC family protein [Bryobacteraceae bacterium]|nr:XdhC family protein [Bryobacteraceae bacterium]
MSVFSAQRRARTDCFAELDTPIPPFVHAPVGLDIGRDTPETVALSIISEIQAALSGRSGVMLKHRKSDIHAQPAETGNLGRAMSGQNALLAANLW